MASESLPSYGFVRENALTLYANARYLTFQQLDPVWAMLSEKQRELQELKNSSLEKGKEVSIMIVE